MEYPIVYTIDATDTVIEVSQSWDNFAVANEGSQLNAEQIVGKSLWSYIAGKDTQKIYKELLASVRAKNKPVSLPYRCDSPDLRRYMSMTISPLANNGVQFANLTLKTEPRPSYHFNIGTLYQGHATILRCSLCNRLQVRNAFLELEEAVQIGELLNESKPVIISYTVCQACNEEVMEKRLFYQKLAHTLTHPQV